MDNNNNDDMKDFEQFLDSQITNKLTDKEKSDYENYIATFGWSLDDVPYCKPSEIFTREEDTYLPEDFE